MLYIRITNTVRAYSALTSAFNFISINRRCRRGRGDGPTRTRRSALQPPNEPVTLEPANAVTNFTSEGNAVGATDTDSPEMEKWILCLPSS